MHKFMTMKLKFDEKQFEIDFFVNFTWHKSYEISTSLAPFESSLAVDLAAVSRDLARASLQEP